MTSQDEGQKVCIEIADLPRDDLAWLSDTAAAIEGAIGEELPTGGTLPPRSSLPWGRG